ncbi:MAG: hypothetical protein ACI4TH_00980 [Candidatus Ornithomonoglobus sp.]
MKKRILSITTSPALVLPMMCAFNIVKPQTAQAEYSAHVAQVNGIDYYFYYYTNRWTYIYRRS